MASGYDPQRSRARRRVPDTQEPAPVDALLGPMPDGPDADGTPDALPASSGAPVHEAAPEDEPAAAPPRQPLVVDLDPPAGTSGPARSRALLWVVAVLSVIAQVVAYLWWRRRRAAHDGG
jgi:hypothetical protein